jgi:CDP-paratose 2-epimerase
VEAAAVLLTIEQVFLEVLEAFGLIGEISGKPMQWEYVDENRIGDHICYISDLAKMRAHYPEWDITKDLRTTFVEIHDAWCQRMKA